LLRLLERSRAANCGSTPISSTAPLAGGSGGRMQEQEIDSNLRKIR
jgi:hypothetical protein